MAATHAWDGMSHDMRDVGAITRAEPAHQAYLALWVGFVALPLIVGLDKLIGFLDVNWEGYLAGWVNNIVPGSASDAMMIVGIVEIAAAVLVAVAPRIGAYVVAAWLAGIILNLLTASGWYDVALRDFGLMLGALTLARLASVYDPPLRRHRA
jgi:hypothetical protein